MTDLTFALGPTNTGKTHRAVERMLEHSSGMIGFPLRLLAREVYDRITKKIGEREVALVTGEEKRVPAAPRYWIATVEAMPIDLSVDFLAVDEIQLAAHRERGHVFTDRLLHARGRRETMFLGADTMLRLTGALFGDADVRRPSRLSTLRHVGRTGLGGLPPRSAVVAFSAEEVYEIAARLKVRRGGAAVVLGGLSPRTRNAQVALYQSGEVQHLVATDAIGMGLNLDLDHVAFASIRKFDGKGRRRLRDAELAQVAGRAGRYHRDGTFGTLSPEPALEAPTVRAIEAHDFAPVRRLVWRSSDLDYTSLENLVASLAAPSPDERFVRVEQSDDFDALRALAARPEIVERARTEERARLLWEVCQIPDYRKLLLLRHVGLLGEIFVSLVDDGRIDADWIEGHVRRIDRAEGEVDTLTARLAAIRVWTYVSHRARWVEDPARWQERTRAIEDRLSDALHARLVERFVERGRTKRRRARSATKAAAGPFAALSELLEDEAEELQNGPSVDAIVAASPDAIEAAEDGWIVFEGARVGRLARGKDVASPAVVVESVEGAGARRRVERRLIAWSRDLVSSLVGPEPQADSDPAVRGLLYQLRGGLGAARTRDVRAQLDAAPAAELERMGLRVGRRVVFLERSVTPSALRARAALVRARFGARYPVGAEALDWRAVERDALLCAGYEAVGPRLLRVDVLEQVLATLRAQSVPFEPPPHVVSQLGGDVPTKLWAALGYRVEAAGLVPKRRRRAR